MHSFSTIALITIWVALLASHITAFSIPRASSNFVTVPTSRRPTTTSTHLKSTTQSEPQAPTSTRIVTPVFEFSKRTEDKLKSIDSFERIDDAIMGGISLSALKDVEGQPYASWSGVCRTDGG